MCCSRLSKHFQSLAAVRAGSEVIVLMGPDGVRTGILVKAAEGAEGELYILFWCLEFRFDSLCARILFYLQQEEA